MADDVRIEVVFGLAGSQLLQTVDLPGGSTVADALAKSDIARRFPAVETGGLPVGIWGRVVSRDHALKDGDRVEVYRPLELDPREARRQLAQSGKTMRRGEG